MIHKLKSNHLIKFVLNAAVHKTFIKFTVKQSVQKFYKISVLKICNKK